MKVLLFGGGGEGGGGGRGIQTNESFYIFVLIDMKKTERCKKKKN